MKSKVPFFIVIMASELVGKGSMLNALCHSDGYYCPSDRTCHPRIYRCTNVEYCNYGKGDCCFKNHSLPDGAYGIIQGHVKSDAVTGWFKRFRKIDQIVLIFRGLLYEEDSKDHVATVYDINDPFFKYGDYYRDEHFVDEGGVKKIGSSYCEWEDAQHFVHLWNSLDCKGKKFNDAFMLFLTTGKCAMNDLEREREKEYRSYLYYGHARMVIAQITGKC